MATGSHQTSNFMAQGVHQTSNFMTHLIVCSHLILCFPNALLILQCATKLFAQYPAFPHIHTWESKILQDVQRCPSHSANRDGSVTARGLAQGLFRAALGLIPGNVYYFVNNITPERVCIRIIQFFSTDSSPILQFAPTDRQFTDTSVCSY